MKDLVDVVIVLNHPPIGNIFRIIKRYLEEKFFGKRRVGWTIIGTNELRFDFLFNTLKWRTRQLPRIRANIKEYSLEEKVMEINSIESVFEKVIAKI